MKRIRTCYLYVSSSILRVPVSNEPAEKFMAGENVAVFSVNAMR